MRNRQKAYRRRKLFREITRELSWFVPALLGIALLAAAKAVILYGV
jgi:hypothetical protein